MPDEKPNLPAKPDTPQSIVDPTTVKDRRILPEGVVPKQAQGYVVAGLALLILMVVMFPKNHPRSSEKTPLPAAATSSSADINERKIEELEQDLTADQRQSQQPEASRSAAASTSGNAVTAMNTAQPTGAAPATQLPPTTEPPRDPIADAEKSLVFKARFASNLVGRDDRSGYPSVAADADTSSTAATSAGLRLQAPAAQIATPSANKKLSPEVNINSMHGQLFVVFEGTTIDTTLVNRLDGEFSGPVKVMVTNPVYSQDRQHVLVPEGTFLLGDVQKVSGLGQKRLAVTFHRMIMPDGYNIDLDQFHGLDQAGETGIKDKVNNHYLAIFGASIALGVIAGAAEATTNSGYEENGADMYRQGLASNLAQSGSTVLDKFINIPPAISIREGHRIKVYLTQDLLLPAYENHDMPGVM